MNNIQYLTIFIAIIYVYGAGESLFLQKSKLKVNDFKCIKWDCECLADNIVFIWPPYCPNTEVNKCYENAKCKKVKGDCKWIMNHELEQCLKEAEGKVISKDNTCITSGCSGQICQHRDDPPTATTCEWRAEYGCLRLTKCEPQADGKCAWTPNEQYKNCLADPLSYFADAA